jgi:hypothetical protein
VYATVTGEPPNTVSGGGNAISDDLMLAAMVNWHGPVTEAQFPTGSIAEIPFSQWDIEPQQHVQGYAIIEGLEFNAKPDQVTQRVQLIKQLVLQYGAVASASDMHAYAIIGWDDGVTYEPGAGNDDRSTNTIISYQPGCFIIKDPWGIYRYAPYYGDIDRYLYDLIAFTQTQPANNYDYNYFLPAQFGSSYHRLPANSNTLSIANIIPVGNSAQAQQLAAIGFACSWEGAGYSIYVNAEGDQLDAARLTKVAQGSFGLPGYQTVPLDKPLAIPAGASSIAVAIVLDFPQAIELIPASMSQQNPSRPANSGYVSINGLTGWEDLRDYGMSFIINAFANDLALTNAPATVSYDANGGSGAPAAQLKAYGEPLVLSASQPARE